jgi:acyl transferase domain-containing protein
MLSSDSAIAIIGMAGRFPGARSVDEFWRNLREGVESVVPQSDEELRAAGVPETLLTHPDYVKVAAPLPDMECFDGGFFGFNKLEADIMDPQHRHFLEVSWGALEHAGHVPSRFKGQIGLFAGSGHNAYMPYNLLTHPELVRSVGMFLLRHTGNDKDFMVTRVSYLLDLRGPSLNIQTACSTSLVAVHVAGQSLLNGECDLALAGGATIELPHRQGYLYQDGEILSPDGHCRSFDASSAGTVFGSGAGVVVLRRLADALADGDTIYAVIRGSAVNNDGAQKVGYLAPSVGGQARAVAEALAVSGVEPDTVSYVEAHGTGTPVGDPIEVAALTQAYREGTDRVGYCGIGSVKSNIGHLDTAAGVASLIKVVQSLRHEELPASLHFAAPNPACQFEQSPFRVQAVRAPWPRGAEPRRAGVSSLGVGGTNAHVVVEEAPVQPATPAGRAWQLLPLSAKTQSAAESMAANLAAHFKEDSATSLADAAWTLQIGRSEFAYRAFAVAPDAGSAPAALEQVAGNQVVRTPDARPALAWMFAGGGAQHAGMGSDLYRTEPVYRNAIDEGLAAIPAELAASIRPLLWPEAGHEKEAAKMLERPSLGLPALLLTQYATGQLWASWGVKPAAMIGHSMGEYTAALFAGVFTLRDALALVALRGRLFEQVPEGSMLSVPLPEAELGALLPAELSIAALNAPGLSVASGPVPAIEALTRDLESRDIECSRIRINVAAHSAMLEPIMEEFGAFFRRVRLSQPEIPFVSNVTGTWITPAEATDPVYWVRHLRQTVRFADGIGTLLQEPGRLLLEVGPGRTLATLARLHPSRRPTQITTQSLRHPDEPTPDAAAMLTALGRLWQHGLPVDWSLVQGPNRRRVALPTYPFARERHWIAPGRIAAEGVAEETTELKRLGQVADWFFEPEWREKEAPTLPGTLEGCSLVFADRGGFGDRLAARLRALGGNPVVVHSGAPAGTSGDDWTIDPSEPEAYERIIRGLVDRETPPATIFHCWALDDTPDQSMETVYQATCFSLLYLAQALEAVGLDAPMKVLALTSGLHTLAGEGQRDPRSAVLLGPLRVLPRELRNVSSVSLDILPGRPGSPVEAEAIDRVLAELTAADVAETVLLRRGRRWVEEYRPHRREAAASRLKTGGRYLITGGLGGIGLSLAEHLAARHQAKLVLVGRTGLPPRAEWDQVLASHQDESAASRIRAIRRLEAAGAEVVTVAADIVSESPKVVEAASERFGGLDGVFHAAGTLEDGVMALKDTAGMRRVLSPKVDGTVALAQALADQRLDFICLFSSLSAIAGLPGQVDYAAANAYLDAAAGELTRRLGIPTVAIGWGAWRDVGMAAELARRLGFGESQGWPAPDQPVEPPHPFLERWGRENGRADFSTRFSPARHWLLSEHRVRGGDTLVPGTGFLELARAAWERMAGTPTAEFREVGFASAFAVLDGEERELEVRLSRAASGGAEFRVVGHGPAGEQEHVRGIIASPAAGEPARVALDAIRRRCPRVVSRRGTRLSEHLDFGPRWQNLSEIAFGDNEALLTLELPESFRGELATMALHPALLDIATAGAQELIAGINVAADFLVPLSYGRLTQYAPLTARAMSHVRLAPSSGPEMATFHATITDPDGRVLVEVEDFTMIRLRDRSQLAAEQPRRKSGAQHAAVANPILEIGLRDGIRPAEGMEAIERILSGQLPERVLVSPLPLTPLLRVLRAPAAPAGSQSMAEATGPTRDLSPAEAALRAHEAVAEVALAERRDQAGELRIVAWIAYRPGEQATGSELRRLLRERGAEELVPHAFVEVDRIPRTGGQPDWSTLPSPFGEAEETVAPRNDTERTIAELWSELLGNSSIGVRDNFFDIGGHSLLAVRFIAKLHRKLGVRLLHEQIVVHTLEQLAAKVDEMRPNAQAS